MTLPPDAAAAALGDRYTQDADDEAAKQHLDALSSPASSPLTPSPDSTPFLSLAEHNFTPLSMFDDSYDVPEKSGGGAPAGQPYSNPEEAGGGQSVAAMPNQSAPERDLDSSSGAAAGIVERRVSPLRASTPPVVSRAPDAQATADSAPCAVADDQQQNHQGRSHERGRYRSRYGQGDGDDDDDDVAGDKALQPISAGNSASDRVSASALARGHKPEHEEDPVPARPAPGPTAGRPSATQASANTASSSSPKLALLDLHGHGFGSHAHDTLTTSPLSTEFPAPFRTASVQPDIQLAQPRPKPIVRTTSDSGSLDIKHPTPDLNLRSGAYVGNIAQLEATAERLSMTSSIDDAIRDLHCELKRSDSRRSSILAARRANSADDNNSATPASAVGQLKRHLSTSSSIVSTNIAARHGGYSPAAYVMSPSHSLTGRLRSGSKNSAGRPEIDLPPTLSRHGPGKASVRSVRSTKLSLQEISEMEPISLTQDVLDKADTQDPVKHDEHDSFLPAELRDANMPATDMFHRMMGDHDFLDHTDRITSPEVDDQSSHLLPHDDEKRPGSSGSANTFQQCQEAFGDFDGVHWVPEHDDDPYAPPDESEMPPPPVPRMPQTQVARPQSYMDPETGQQMLYYPARVPAMLNLPPKLSTKPKSAERNNRRSQVLSVMMETNRQSRFIEKKQSAPENIRDSWLPDPLAGHRNSFAALSSEQLNQPSLHQSSETRSVHTDEQPQPQQQQPVAEPEIRLVPESDAEPLRRPRRLSRMDPEKRKSRMSRLDLPPQLRASAYFDIPTTTAPEIEVKDGSAMATLESILDASAHAPVNAFTDHNYAGRLGPEVYGKEKKRVSMAPSAVLQTSPEKTHKRKSSFMWMGKRHSHEPESDEEEHRGFDEEQDARASIHTSNHLRETGSLHESDNESHSHVIRVGIDPSDDEYEEVAEDVEDVEQGEDEFHGPPTTLLAELQLRKQRQKQRTQNHFPNGMHATLLEMDAVAETERKNRKGKKVNLAWEDVDPALGEEESDDEDVPLAILAARNQGAKNIMDLNRPLGLMERRELEDNEPLSARRARLTGQDPRALMVNHRPSMMNLSAHSSGGQPMPSPGEAPQDNEEDSDVEEETLADRKRRLAGEDNPLPKARPVSSVFTAELLSQFGDHEEKKKQEEEKENKAPAHGEEETLGQRRRRLQAEREAREREMSFNALNAEAAPPPPSINRRMNMADVLAAHPKREADIRAQEDLRRMERENMIARERDAKMAAMRSQMPTSLVGPSVTRSGGYHSGAFNDGTGGQGADGARAIAMRNAQPPLGPPPPYQARQSTVFSTYGAPMQQPYGSMVNLNTMNNMGYGNAYGGMNPMGMNAYSNAGLGVYGGGMMQPGMQMPMHGGSMDRVEQWRQGVLP